MDARYQVTIYFLTRQRAAPNVHTTLAQFIGCLSSSLCERKWSARPRVVNADKIVSVIC